MEHVEVVEGRARLLLPAGERAERGPGDKGGAPVFYNPAMALNRDLSSLLLATRAKDGWHVLDALAASGVRGLRYALEAGVRLDVHWNDWNPVAVRLIEENARRNGVPAKATQRNVASLLQEMVWHVVDLDPFGSPAAFLDGATRAARDGGVLGVTATDATALAGVYPNVCRRRYLATPLHGELAHEVALRILAGAAVRQAAKHDVALSPLLAHATDHYYRVAFAVRRGSARADDALRRIGGVHLCPACGDRGLSQATTCPACGEAVRTAGPLWTGPLVDADATAAMLARVEGHALARRDEAIALLRALDAESRAPPLFFDLHETGSRLRMGSPPTAPVVAALEAQGFRVGPVHFDRLALRTDASARDLERILRDLRPTTRS